PQGLELPEDLATRRVRRVNRALDEIHVPEVRDDARHRGNPRGDAHVAMARGDHLRLPVVLAGMLELKVAGDALVRRRPDLIVLYELHRALRVGARVGTLYDIDAHPHRRDERHEGQRHHALVALEEFPDRHPGLLYHPATTGSTGDVAPSGTRDL